MTAIQLDNRTKGVVTEEKRVDLTPGEYALCAWLMQHPGAVWTRQQLMERCEFGEDIQERSLDSAVKRLRQKLNSIGIDPIMTRYGFGYTWNDPS